LARQTRARFVYASTSEIYGDPLEHPQTEGYWGNVNPVGPRACYDEAKRAGEAYVSTYRRKFGLDTRMVRIFNTYGPRMDINDGRVVTNFIKQMQQKEPLEMYGDGSQTRSFCYISDLVEAIYQVAFADKARGEIFNIGNTKEYTVKELANILMKIAEYKGTLVFKPLPEDDPKRRKPDLSKMEEFFEWKPQVSVEEGLKKTLTYFKEKSL
jgi:nucleoside-diphosphate-sugar epimerase